MVLETLLISQSLKINPNITTFSLFILTLMVKMQTIISTLLTWELVRGWMLKKWFMVGTREVTSEWRRLLFEKAWETAEQAGLVVTRSLSYCPVQFWWLPWLIWPHQNTVLTAAVLPPPPIFWIFNTIPTFVKKWLDLLINEQLSGV